VLTPAQCRTLEALRRSDDDPVVFDRAFVHELRADAAEGLGELAERLGEETLAVNKFNIADVLACETHFVAPEPFAWSPALACGKVAHRAIELHLNWRGEPTPTDLVDDVLARLGDEETTFGDWVAAQSPGDEADLRGRAIARVTQFVECFPPLRHAWHPVTEAQVRWPLDAPIVLRAKADIVIGRAAGAESRKVLIDLKTGRIFDRHREDLRFYALVETLARQVPPRLVASFSLEAGEAVVEPVGEAMLRTSLRRALDAVERIVELTVEGRRPRPPPSLGCFRCRQLAEVEHAPAGDAVGAPSADDVDEVTDGEMVPDRHGVRRAYADASCGGAEHGLRADALQRLRQ
jgi:hypothetical protein